MNFIKKDDKLGVQLRIEVFSLILLLDWLDKHMPSQDATLMNQ